MQSPRLGDPMPRFAQRDGRTRELVVTGTPALSLINQTVLFYLGKNIESLCAGAESKI